MDLKGRLLANRYEILEKIGSGGMATVYKAKCHVLNRYVAIKILRDEFTTDEEFVKRFEVEAQSAASITHPNIVSVYDVGVDGNLHYIVMELVKGKTLKDIIVEEKGPLPWKWSVNIAIPIVIMVANSTLMVLTIVSRKRYMRYALYHMLTFLFSMIQLILLFCGVLENKVLTIVASGIAGLSLLLTVILCGKAMWEETKKRLHM